MLSATRGARHARAPCLSSARTTKHFRTRAAGPPRGSPEHMGTPAGRRGLSSTPSRQQCWPHAETTAAEAGAEKRSLSSVDPSAGREHARAGSGTTALPPPASGGVATPRLWSHHANLCSVATSLLCVDTDRYAHVGVHTRGVCTPVLCVPLSYEDTSLTTLGPDLSCQGPTQASGWGDPLGALLPQDR